MEKKQRPKKKYAVIVAVHEEDSIVTIMDAKKRVVAVSDAINVRDVAKKILEVIDNLCVENNIAREEIARVHVESVLGEGAISQRAMRTIESVFAYAQKTAQK